MPKHKRYAQIRPLSSRLVVAVGLTLLLLLAGSSVGFAQEDATFVRQVRIIESDELGVSSPAGLAFLPEAGVFYVVEARVPGRSPAQASELSVVAATPLDDQVGRVRVMTAVSDPLNMAFDGKAGRLLIFQSATLELVDIAAGSDGELGSEIVRHSVPRFGLRNPQGMTVDPASGRLFVLDSIGPRIVRVDPDSDGGFDSAAIAWLDLVDASMAGLRGLAFNPANGHLYTLDPAQMTLQELTQNGRLVASHDLSAFDLANPQGLTFAPTGDLTDDPALTSLYIADTGLESGQIVELTFDQVEPLAIEADVTAVLVQTINAWLFDPPSTDTSGIAYLSSSDTLLMSDSEVEGTPYWTGDNLYESSLTGSLLDTSTTVPFSIEPTGVAYDPAGNRLFISDDDQELIFEVDLGGNGTYDPSDSRYLIDTSAFASGDPEGVAYDTWRGFLFVADGINDEVYKVDPGSNGVFDGPPSAGGDDVVSSFDTAGLGINDPGGITFDPESGYLYIIGRPQELLAHVTIDGVLVRMIDISAAAVAAAGGLTVAPGSLTPAVNNIYVSDRGVDQVNDGRVYEMYVSALSPDVTISKTVEPAVVAPGDVIAYTLTFANEGGGTATGVVITDIIPSEVDVTSVISSGVVIVNSGATPPYVWNVQDLTTVDEGVIVITGQVTSTLSCFDSFTNEAIISTTSDDTRPGNNSSSVTVAAGAGVSVDPVSDAKPGDQGQGVVYSVRVTNEGACTDTFDVSVSGTAWTVTAPSTVGPLGPGEYDDVQVTVHVPSDAPCGPEAATVTFTSQGAGSVSASSDLVTTVSTVYGLEVGPPTAGLSGLPGAELSYTLSVINTGNCVDTFDLAASEPNWITSAPASVGPLVPDVSFDIDVVATVPLDALCTDQDITTVTLTSSDGTTSASSILTSSVLPVAGVQVEPAAATSEAAPGLEAPYMLRVTNIGNCTDTFDFSVAGDEWPASAPPSVGPLAPDAYADVDVSVTVPSGAQCADGDSATVTFTSQADGAVSDWSILTTSVSTIRAVSVVPPAPGLSGNPGSDVTYELFVHNQGNCIDTFDVAVSGTSWSVTPQYTEMILDPNELASIDVTVHVPAGAPCGPEAATVTFTSSDGVTSDASILTTTVNPVYGVSVTPPAPSDTADPGTDAVYTLRVTNEGNCSDTFAFSATGDQWPASAPSPVGPLAPDTYADVDVSVAVPADALCGDNDSAIVTFTSQNNGAVSDSSLLATSANAVPAVSVTPASAIGSAMPGFDAVYTLRVTNEGNCPDTFGFSAIGDQWPAGAIPSSVPLDPDAYADVDVSVAVPSDAQCTDSDIASVIFTSGIDGTTSDSSTLNTSAGAVYGVTVDPPTDTGTADPGAGAVYTLRVTNIGNCADTLTFSAGGDEWTASSQPSAVGLNGGEFADVDVTVAIPADAWCGESDIATVTFTSSGDAGVSDSSGLTTSVNTVYGVAVEPSVDAKSGHPDTDVVYTLSVTNTGNCSDTFNRSIVGNAWAVSSVPSVGPLDPDAGAQVDVTVSVPACTLGGASDSATVTWISQSHGATTGGSALTTSADHVAPVAGDDQYDVPEDGSRIVAVPGVLANDTDANCEDLTVSDYTLPAHGTLALAPDGSFAYTPTLNYHGIDTFTYDASDGALSDTATVTITVTSAGDDPIVDAGPDQPGQGDPPIYELDLVSFEGSFIDPKNQSLFAGENIHWDFGDGNSATGTLTPDHAYLDDDVYMVTLTVTDVNGDVGQDWLTVTVLNAVPEVYAGPDQKAEPGETLSFTGVFTDTAADTHTIQWDLDDGTTIDDLLTFDHAFDATGDYTVTLTVTDDDGGVGTDTAIISVRLKVYLPIIFR